MVSQRIETVLIKSNPNIPCGRVSGQSDSHSMARHADLIDLGVEGEKGRCKRESRPSSDYAVRRCFLVVAAFLAASLRSVGPLVPAAFTAARCRALGPR